MMKDQIPAVSFQKAVPQIKQNSWCGVLHFETGWQIRFLYLNSIGLSCVLWNITDLTKGTVRVQESQIQAS